MSGHYELRVSGQNGVGGYLLTATSAPNESFSSTFQPSTYRDQFYSTDEAEAEKAAVQTAIETMMAETGVSAVDTRENSVQSWSRYPSGEGVGPLYPEYLDTRSTNNFYCWDTRGRITYQFSTYTVCPPPPLPPGTPSDGMRQPRTNHTATLLGDGRVLVVGGKGRSYSGDVGSVELFDQKSETWKTA